jgi:hypothetical protein
MSVSSSAKIGFSIGRCAGALLRRTSAVVLAGLLVIGLAQASWAAIIYDVNINTSGLSGVSGMLAFDLINGDGVMNNTVSVTQLATNGTGLDTSDFSISDVLFFNEVQRGLTLGTSLSFSISVTTNFASGTPDGFSFFLLNGAGTASLVTTTDPTGADSLFAIDLNGTSSGLLATYSATNSQGISVTVTPQTSAPIPEPTSLAIWLLVAAGFAVRSRRQPGGKLRDSTTLRAENRWR